jgi:pimeloyl-ACP methyl ester carboxylesterase
VLDFVGLIEERFGSVQADRIIEHQTIRSISDFLAIHLTEQQPPQPTQPGLAEPPSWPADAAPEHSGRTAAAGYAPPSPHRGGELLEADPIERFPLVVAAPRAHAAQALLDYPVRFDADLKGLAGRTEGRAAGEDLQIRLVAPRGEAALEVVTCGTGQPLLMLPGIGLTAPIFHHQFKALSRDHRLIVIHSPGHGRSTAPKTPTVEALVGTLQEALEALRLKRPVDVLASCFGTLVALRLAMAAPHLVHSLCLCGALSENAEFGATPTDGLSAKQLAEITLAAAKSLGADFDGLTEAPANADRRAAIREGRTVLLASQKAQPSVGMRYLNDVLSLTPSQWLSEVRAPTTFIWGTLDSIVGPRAAYELAEQMPHARVVEIEGAGHYPFLSHPDLFERALRRHFHEVAL